jgi:hypothetical protein
MAMTARPRAATLAAALAVTVVSGCATTHDAGDESLLGTPPLSTSAAGVIASDSSTAALPRPSFLVRREVLRVLDRGAGDFLSSIDDDPMVVGGRFRGWLFRGWRDTRYATADFLPNDLVLRINGRVIERPEQLGELWETLRTAGELVVDLERDGKPVTVRYPIKD